MSIRWSMENQHAKMSEFPFDSLYIHMNTPIIFDLIINIFKRHKPMQSKKTPPPAVNKQTIMDSFLFSTQTMYDMTPPPPFPYPKLFHYSLDPARHYHHRFTSSFLTSVKPLTIGCDVGLPVDQLIIYSKQYNNPEGILDEEDEALIKQSIMNVSYKPKKE